MHTILVREKTVEVAFYAESRYVRAVAVFKAEDPRAMLRACALVSYLNGGILTEDVIEAREAAAWPPAN